MYNSALLVLCFFFFLHIFNKKVTNLEKTSINISCDTQCEKSNCSLWKRVSDCHIILEGGQCLVGTNLMVTFLSVFHKSCHGTDKKHTITIKLPLYIKTAQATCYEWIIYTQILLWVCCVYRFCKLCWIVTWRKKVHVSGSFWWQSWYSVLSQRVNDSAFPHWGSQQLGWTQAVKIALIYAKEIPNDLELGQN